VPLASLPHLADATPASSSAFLLSAYNDPGSFSPQPPTRFYQCDELYVPSSGYALQILNRVVWGNRNVLHFTDEKIHLREVM